MRKSRWAGLGLAFSLSAAAVAGVATPASAGSESGNKEDSSLAALVGWLETHPLQDWLNFLALTNPPVANSNKDDGREPGVSHPPVANSNKDYRGEPGVGHPPVANSNKDYR